MRPGPKKPGQVRFARKGVAITSDAGRARVFAPSSGHANYLDAVAVQGWDGPSFEVRAVVFFGRGAIAFQPREWQLCITIHNPPIPKNSAPVLARTKRRMFRRSNETGRFLVQDRFRASLQPLEGIDDSALSGRVARLGELIPQLGYFLVCCAELLCELIDKLIGRTQTAPAADLKSNHRLPPLDTPYWRGC
jgi:hypothetical protein